MKNWIAVDKNSDRPEYCCLAIWEEASLRLICNLREKDGLSIETSNHYLRAIKTFIHWLFQTQRLNCDPLLGVKTLDTRTDRRHDRWAITETELVRLIEVTETGPPTAGLTGSDRAMLYLLAAYTRFRKGELGSLTLKSFRLDRSPNTVTIQAAYSKHRCKEVQILHLDIVEKFKE